MAIKNVAELVKNINASSSKAVVLTTGGGADVFPMLLSRGGGSNTLLAGLIPYSEKETEALLGFKPEKSASLETARALAMAAYQKAVKLRDGDYDVIGVSCTASLQKIEVERPGRLHHIYVGLQTKDRTVTAALTIDKASEVFGLMGPENIREAEEAEAGRMILNAIANGFDIENRCYVVLQDKIVYDGHHSTIMGMILSGERKYYGFMKDVAISLDGCLGDGTAIFPGSFNPHHDGHQEMIDIIASKGKKVIQEISMVNVDKGAIDFITLRNRLRKIAGPVVVTCAPTFVDKSRLFPGVSFIVGVDTLFRILNPKYAGEIAHVCSMFEGNGNYFYVFPRNGNAKGIYGDGNTVIPGEFITEPLQHGHISSTELRKQTSKL